MLTPPPAPMLAAARGPLLRFLLLLAAPAVCNAQTVSAEATFNNIGVEVVFAAAPPAGTTVNLALREAGVDAAYRPAHPLSRISGTTFAGSAFWLDPGTTYSLRLESAVFATNLFAVVTTRTDAFAAPTGTAYYVDPLAGSDASNGLTTNQPFRTLGKALSLFGAGKQIILRGGRYHEGDLEISAAGTAAAPIAIRAMPGEAPVIDGTDTNFVPLWTLHDATHNLYRTPCTRLPNSAFLNGEQFFHYPSLTNLRSNLWNQGSGFATDGTNLYARFPGNTAPGTNVLTIPRYSTGLTLNNTVRHLQITGIAFRQFGYLAAAKGIYLNGADSNVIDRCSFHHVSAGVGIKRDALGNVIQNCFFSESPLATWSWDGVKNNPAYAYESGGIVVYGSPNVNAGNVIRFNTFSNMFDGSLLYSQDATGPTKNMDFHDNRIMYCADDAVETDGYGSNVRIYGNVLREFLSGISVAPCTPGPTYLMRNVMAGSPSYGPDARLPVKFNVSNSPTNQWIYLYHNTLSTLVTNQDGFIMYMYSRWTNVISRNNIYAGQRYAFYGTADPNPIDFDYDNLYDASPAPFARWKGLPYNTFAQFQAASGQELHGWSLPPGFTNAATEDFRLHADSLMIDLGIPIPGVNDRFMGAAPDVGAFEFGVTASAIATTALGVAVDWLTGDRAAYQVEAAGALSSQVWATAGAPITSLVYRVRHAEPVGTATQRFFRLRRLDP